MGRILLFQQVIFSSKRAASLFTTKSLFLNNISPPQQQHLAMGITSSSSTRNPLIKSIIFDYDGIIVDSETIFYRVNKQTLAHFGAEYTMELKHGQMGRKLTEAVDYVLKNTGLAEKGVKQQEYIDLYEKLVEKELPKCEMMPGARELIEHLQSHSIQMAVCTGSASDEFPKKTGKCQDLMEMMNTIVLAGDDPEVKSGKPAPDAYLVTLQRMSPRSEDPSSILVFEDSINGVKSALAAGCTTIWIPQKQFMMNGWEATLEKFTTLDGFAEKLDSLEQFRPEKYGLPPFKKN